MRRVTKASLQAALEASIHHQQRHVIIVHPRELERVRDESGFVPAECYGYGCVPMPGEVGTVGNTRVLAARRA